MQNQLVNCSRRLISLAGVLGISFSIVHPALSQQYGTNSVNSTYTNPANPTNRVNTNTPNFDGKVRGGNRDYPYGSKVYDNGTISTPRGGPVYPNSTIRHGDGTTSYYYPDGSRITVDPTKISPSGTPIRK